MDLLQIREKEIFETLKTISEFNFVLIGGYAVNAYALPRFSVDCDIVLRDKKELIKISKKLQSIGYTESATDKHSAYGGEFYRFEKMIAENFKVSIDILVEKIYDRQSKKTIDASWIFENSSITFLKGKTIMEKLSIRIIDIDALIVTKFISARNTDIRDIFMMMPQAKNIQWIKKEIAKKINFEKQYEKIVKKIISTEFRNNLQGVYGKIDEKTFEKHKQKIIEMNSK